MKTEYAIALFINSRQAKGLSPQTIRWYKGILMFFAQSYSRLPKKPGSIELFLANCRAGDERIHGYYRALKCFFRFLHRRYAIPNPIECIEPPHRLPKLPKPLTPDELDQLLAYPHKSTIKAILLFLSDTGARVGEAANLKLNNIIDTPWGATMMITGKTGTRLVPISSETHQALLQCLPFSYTTYRLRRLVSRAFRDAHVRGSGINLRHTFGTLWAGDELILQQIMGHSHLSTTRIYRALRTERISEQHHKYSPLKMVLSMSKSML